ncbi:MAG: sensor histidine kinase [Acidobacteria bacterium]|nr:sensor histidine kinase [Acidobacteriota bacterium]
MVRSGQLDLVTPRVVFRAYAVGVAAFGLLVFLWGPVWIHGALNWPGARPDALVRIAGGSALLLACAAAGLQQFDEDHAGRRALRWFVGGHWLLASVLLLQARAIWGYDVPRWYGAGLNVALLVSSLLLAGQAVVEDRGRRTTHSLVTLVPDLQLDLQMRSRYEHEIRKAAALEERARFARDLHDAVKQQIFAIQTSAATAEARLAGDPAEAAAALARIRDGARSAMTELDSLIAGLRTSPIELSGLRDALRRECEALELRTGAKVTLEIGALPPSGLLPPGAPDALYRIAQEALSNVARHARATAVHVSLHGTAHSVELAVEDDGVGVDGNRTSAGQGLDNIRERAREHKGHAEIGTRLGGGTSLVVWMPLYLVEPAYFRTRAVAYGLATLALAVIFLARWVPLTFSASFLPLGLFAFNCVRYAVAWRRARRLVAATS